MARPSARDRHPPGRNDIWMTSEGTFRCHFAVGRWPAEELLFGRKLHNINGLWSSAGVAEKFVRAFRGACLVVLGWRERASPSSLACVGLGGGTLRKGRLAHACMDVALGL